ncbi:MAG: deoxyribodipyrimidine photolyase, partial [Gammaproteobacteria bacterium]|nr:deoxyribodipyrimidine photolyase [Gammaproteobacteria bacterium]
MTHDTPLRIVWFKRDLRVSDHAPLLHASRGKVIPLYILETGYWTLKDTSARQQDVLIAALRDLNAALSKLGAPLIVRQGDAVDVFKTLLAAHPVTEVVSHEETGNAWTYQRDLQVAKLLQSQNIPWREFPNHGVVRGLKDRDGWSKRWHQTMASAQVHPPEQLEPGADLTSDIDQLRASGASNEWLITARADAEQGLESFLQARGASYHLSMSSPLTAESACSRLSVPLSLGLISMREIYQATQVQTKRVRANKKDFPDTWPKALQAFGSRLRWHCHFMQKLEDEPAIELKTMHPAYEAVR